RRTHRRSRGVRERMAALQRPAILAPRALVRSPGKLLLYGVIALVVVAAIFQVNRFSRLTTRGYEINDLQRVRSERQAANHELEAEVAGLSSLARGDWEARTRLKLEAAPPKADPTVHRGPPQRQPLPTRFLPPQQTSDGAGPASASEPF